VADNFDKNMASWDAPALNGFAVVPHVSNPLAFVARAVWVGGTGDITGGWSATART
jgi:hypothetical protein